MASSPFTETMRATASLDTAMDLESLYASRRNDILRLLLHSGVNFSEAEDVTQQVFLNAYERPESTPREGSLFSWIVTCARNLAISRYRRSQRETLAPSERWKEWKEAIADPAKSILAQLEEQQEYATLTRALEQLSFRQQQCILLRSQGYTFDEIADALGLSRRNVVYAVGAALRELQQSLRASDTAD